MKVIFPIIVVPLETLFWAYLQVCFGKDQELPHCFRWDLCTLSWLEMSDIPRNSLDLFTAGKEQSLNHSIHQLSSILHFLNLLNLQLKQKSSLVCLAMMYFLLLNFILFSFLPHKVTSFSLCDDFVLFLAHNCIIFAFHNPVLGSRLLMNVLSSIHPEAGSWEILGNTSPS